MSNTIGTGIVTSKETNNNGKQKICIDGQWYYAGRCDVSSLQVGNRIDYEWNTFGNDPNKPLKGLQSWGLSANQPTADEVKTAQAAAAPKLRGKGGWGGGGGRNDRSLEIDLQCMRFVGQIVAATIEKVGALDNMALKSTAKAAWDAISFARDLQGPAPAPVQQSGSGPSAAPRQQQAPKPAEQPAERVRPTGNLGYGNKFKDTPWNVIPVANLQWFRDNANSEDVRKKAADELWFRERDTQRVAAYTPDTPNPDDDFDDDIPF